MGGALIALGVLSAAGDIYWYTRGCKDVVPKLEGNIEDIERLQTQANNQRDMINLDWNPSTLY